MAVVVSIPRICGRFCYAIPFDILFRRAGMRCGCGGGTTIVVCGGKEIVKSIECECNKYRAGVQVRIVYILHISAYLYIYV